MIAIANAVIFSLIKMGVNATARPQSNQPRTAENATL